MLSRDEAMRIAAHHQRLSGREVPENQKSGMYNVLFDAFEAGYAEGQFPNLGETMKESFEEWLRSAQDG